VWRDDAVRRSNQRVVSHGRLDAEHVSGIAGNDARGERIGERLLVDQRAATGIDDERRRLHRGQAFGVQQRFGVRGQRAVQ
jgi:hypothetical protein